MPPTDPGVEDEKSSATDKVRRSKLFSYARKFFLDMLPVIAGVVIGMFVNSYTEEQRNQNLLESTLHALSYEFLENTQEMKNKLPRYNRIIDSLNYYMDNKQYNLYEILLKAGGLTTSKITTTNWQVTLNNYSLQLINFPTVQLLSRIENVHEEQTKLVDLLTAMAYGPAMYKRGDEGLASRKNLFDMMINYKSNEEERLQLYYDFANIVITKRYKQK
jgi:hypothetical protein